MNWWNPIDWTSGAWEALAGWGTLVVAALAARFALHQVREARRTREEQAQPFVVVDFEPSEASGTIMNIVVKNTGTTLARDIKIKFDPPLESAHYSKPENIDGYHPAKLQMFVNGIPSLPPGKSYSTLFDTMPERHKSELPRRYTATVHFSSTRGPLEPLVYVLDLDLYFGRQYVHVKTIHDAANALDEIKKTVNKWTTHFNGVRVYTHDEDARQQADRAERERSSATAPDTDEIID